MKTCCWPDECCNSRPTKFIGRGPGYALSLETIPLSVSCWDPLVGFISENIWISNMNPVTGIELSILRILQVEREALKFLRRFRGFSKNMRENLLDGTG